MINPRFTARPLKLNLGDVFANDLAFRFRQGFESIAYRFTAATRAVEDGVEFWDVWHEAIVPQKVLNAIELHRKLCPAPHKAKLERIKTKLDRFS